ncbi:MAG: biopolymer transporter ExbD [Myxococcota bacterium]
MSLGDRTSGLRARRKARGQGAVVELTPLIDIVFQLLIFFLLTATFQNNPMFKVNLPKAENRDTSQEPKAVVVTVSDTGKMEVEGKPVDARELELRLCKAAESKETTTVNIRADEATAHRHVVRVMDVAKRCKLERLGILHGQ